MSCGPTNALQKLSNHAQVDRSLQHDPQQRLQASTSQFRTQHANTLDRDFQAHQQRLQQFDPMFTHAFQAPVTAPQLHRQQTQQTTSSSWANDFKTSNVNTQSQGWNTQFMNQMNTQGTSQEHHMKSQQAQAQQQMQYHLQQSRLNSSLMYTPQMSQSFASATRQTEHQQLHNAYLTSQMSDLGEFDELDKEFDSLEKELQNVKMDEETEMQLPVDNNVGFREAAKKVADVMKTSDNTKFANSKFLDLMNKVSAGQVGLNQDESKLVDSNGQDIHEKQIDPSHQKAQSGSHANLPDPLEFVQDGTLESPFQSAKLIGKQHQEKYTWDDVYEDYRHDDTSF